MTRSAACCLWEHWAASATRAHGRHPGWWCSTPAAPKPTGPTSSTHRFQNYRAKFTVPDIATASRAWLTDIVSGDPLSANCPRPWRRWVTGRHYEALVSTRIQYRLPQEQQPPDQAGQQILRRVYTHFAARPTSFEPFANAARGNREITIDRIRTRASQRYELEFRYDRTAFWPAGHCPGCCRACRLLTIDRVACL